jgi:hypothetical protein
MYTNNSNDSTFPKTLEIRNEKGGMIWQIYHVNNLDEARLLAKGSESNGFEDSTLVDFKEGEDETFSTWRKECSKELKEVLT